MTDQRPSVRAAYAKHVLNKHLVHVLNQKTETDEDLKSLPLSPPFPHGLLDGSPFTGRICIVGAGATGLYLAMMLKYLNIDNVDILEASDRVGGRIYTQRLPGKNEYHNYYDVGAMRIPQIDWMQGTLDFIDDLNIKKAQYIYENPNEADIPCCYWYRHKPITDGRFTKLMDSMVADFLVNFDTALKKWLNTNRDNYSTRAWLMTCQQSEKPPSPNWSYEETARAELSDTSTGLFDQSFTETVIDYADFGAAKKVPWWRLDTDDPNDYGGMHLLTDTMQAKLASTSWPTDGSPAFKVTTKSAVTAMAYNPGTKKVSVTAAGQKPVQYDMVFNTTAMAPLQRMDLQGLNLPDDILTGIRTLSYDRATKVAIRFSRPWWHPHQPKPETVYGGVSSSDLPIRNVVYPSWNDGKDNHATLMVSYSWAQDASRVASLIPDYNIVKPTRDDPIVTLCLQNLVKLWSGQPYKPTFEDLYGMYVSHHAWAWEHDPYTGGAFALFGPGQFKNVYPKFYKLQCGNKLALCGEALSAHHAWISGAFDSAYQKIMQFLLVNRRLDDIKALKQSIFGNGKGEHPEEMDEELLKWSVLLGDGGGPEGWGDEYKQKKAA